MKLREYRTSDCEQLAKPFFQHRGYHVVKEQEVIRGGIALKNYVMEKSDNY